MTEPRRDREGEDKIGRDERRIAEAWLSDGHPVLDELDEERKVLASGYLRLHRALNDCQNTDDIYVYRTAREALMLDAS